MGTHRNLGEDVEDKRQDRHVHLDPVAAKPLLQILWHRDGPGGDVHGDKDPAQGQKQPGCLGEWGEGDLYILDAERGAAPIPGRALSQEARDLGPNLGAVWSDESLFLLQALISSSVKWVLDLPCSLPKHLQGFSQH